jgi:hypothetical protein
VYVVMRRRKFVATGGTLLLAYGYGRDIVHEPVIGANFNIEKVEQKQPENLNSVMLKFTRISLYPQYIDESESATITVILSLEGYEETKSTTTTNLKNGEIIDKDQLNLSDSLVLSGLNTTELFLRGTATLKVEHPSIGTKEYKRNFTVTDSSDSFSDGLQDGSINTFWSTNIPNQTSISEGSSYLTLSGGNDDRPTLYSDSIFNNNPSYEMNFKAKSEDSGQIRVLLIMEEDFSYSREIPDDMILLNIKEYGGGGLSLRKVEDSNSTEILSTGYKAPRSFHEYTISFSESEEGTISVTMTDETTQSELFSKNSINFNPTNTTDRFGFQPREQKGDMLLRNFSIDY